MASGREQRPEPSDPGAQDAQVALDLFGSRGGAQERMRQTL